MRRLVPLVAALCAGCSLQPDYKRPALPTASSYPAEGAASGDARASDIGWRQAFTDPRLQAVIALALDNNRDLRTAVLRIEEARAQYRISRSDLLPTVEINGEVTRHRLSDNEANGGMKYDRYAVKAELAAYEIDFWGRVRSLNDAARARYLATAAAQRAFRIGLIADVATAYVVERELEERIALARNTVRSRQEGLEIARLRLEAGVTSAFDYRQSETLLTQAETELAAMERLHAQTLNAITLLTGGPIPADLPAPLPLERQAIAANLDAGLPSELLVNRPDIVAAEERLRAANADIGAARAAFLPRISLTGAFGFASGDLDLLTGGASQAWNFGPQISLPIFNGRALAGLDLTEVRKDIAVADYERTVQAAFRDVADALAGRRWLAAQLAAQQRALLAQADRAALADLRYRNGAAAYIEVLDAQRELFAAEQQLVQIRREQAANLIVLYAALGGGLAQGEGDRR